MLRRLTVLFALGLAACAPAGPFADYVFDTDVYVAELDPTDAVSHGLADVHPDILLVALDDDDALDAVLEEVGGELVGAIPALGFYEIRLPTSDLPSLEAALAAVGGLSGVAGTATNGVEDWEQGADDTCLIHDDNLDNVPRPDRCPFTEMQAYAATTVLREIAKEITLSPVKVGVVDSGLQKSFGQFDDVAVLNLTNPALPPTDTHGHGTRVSGLIAADNGDGSTNGLATAVLDDLVALEVGGFDPNSFALLASVYRAAIDGEADVVNMSFGRRYGANEARSQATIKGRYARLVAMASDTLFVNSAGNVNEELTATNKTPAGLQAPNFITVGGTTKCDELTAWVHSDPTYGSTWGPLVDISAPAQDVPLLPYNPKKNISNPGGAPINGSGTSYSAPMVTAAATLFKSFDSTLTPAEIKDYLLDEAFPTDPKINHRRLVLVTPILQMLMDRGAGAAVLDLIDVSEPEGEPDLPGQVVNRLCGGADLTIPGLGSWHYSAEEEISGSFINDLGFGLIFNDDDEVTNFSVLGSGQPFALLDEYAIPNVVQAVFANSETADAGSAVSGGLIFTRCEIVDRNGLDDTPLYIQLEGSGSGVMEIIEPPNIVPQSHDFELEFNIPLINMGGAAVSTKLEELCDQGKKDP